MARVELVYRSLEEMIEHCHKIIWRSAIWKFVGPHTECVLPFPWEYIISTSVSLLSLRGTIHLVFRTCLMLSGAVFLLGITVGMLVTRGRYVSRQTQTYSTSTGSHNKLQLMCWDVSSAVPQGSHCGCVFDLITVTSHQEVICLYDVPESFGHKRERKWKTGH